MNYHRVVVQLLTWGIVLSELHDDKFSEIVYTRAKKSLAFLDACSDPITGKLPNYGSNDGALFFKLTDCDYRNYRSQLDDLRGALYGQRYFNLESFKWYGLSAEKIPYVYPQSVEVFNKGGFYIMQEDTTKTFLRCGAYKDRPFQSDNLHLDIWVKGVNILHDSGSYRYNTPEEDIAYFNGSQGHNTVAVGDADQMLKGGRFIWFYWVKKAKAIISSEAEKYVFKGSIKAFKQLGKNIWHTRKVSKIKGENKWEIEDVVSNKGTATIYQYWHIPISHKDNISITTLDEDGCQLTPIIEKKWYSGYYGVKEKSIRVTFATEKKIFTTTISVTDL
jgi:hypothetical protein